MAKVKDRKNPYRILIADKAVYVKPGTLSNSIKYEPANVLDEEQWFFVDKFSKTNYCLKLLIDNSFNSVDFVEINKVNPEQMDYLIAYQNGVDFYFQRIFKYTVIRNKKFVHIGDDNLSSFFEYIASGTSLNSIAFFSSLISTCYRIK